MVKRSRIVSFFLIVILFLGIAGTYTEGILKDIKLGLDLQGGFEVLYEVETVDGSKVTSEVLTSTVRALEKRINTLGVSEPNIEIEGENRIRVQLAGVTDQAEARRLLSTEGNLTFRDINDIKLLDGTDLKEGGASQDFDPQTKAPIIVLQLKDAQKFAEVTNHIITTYGTSSGANILAIWLDFEEGVDSFEKAITEQNPNLISSPSVREVINSQQVTITGNFTVAEAQELADLLNAGSLPVKLTEIFSTSVGAQFGEEALAKTVTAGIIGISAIFIFMLVFYRFPGFIAVITLTIYTFLVLLIFDWMNAVLTLPGIAALVLGVGMAVDANIITYERIKEELRVGRSVRAAFTAGAKTSFRSIFDANITTLIVAGVLFVYGTSSIKGFATLLIISILVSFITSVYGTRLLLSLWVNSGYLNNKFGFFGVKKDQIFDISEGKDAHDLPTKFDRFDFVKHRKKFYAFSSIITIIGIIVISIFGLNLGIDFSAGSRIELSYEQAVDKTEVEAALEKLGIQAESLLESNAGTRYVIRTKQVLDQEEILQFKEKFEEEYAIEPTVSTVSPQVGKDLAMNGIKALLIASIGIVIYVAIRFELKMAIPAILALLHDAFFVVLIFSITRIEVDITFIAAILTVIGYSLNDTIITFDRVRENIVRRKKLKTEQEIHDVVNEATRQVMTRSINTVSTVLFTILALIFFGAGAIFNFSIALLIGTIAGVYSSIFLATQIWGDWKVRELRQRGPLKTEKEKRINSDEPIV